MYEQVRRRLAGVVDVDHTGIGANLAGVADLAAGLAIERRAIEHDLDLLPGFGLLHRSVDTEDRDDRGIRLLVLVAKELGARRDRRVEIGAVAAGILEGGQRAAGLALLRHRRLEPGVVDFEPFLVREFGREIEREAVGVVEAEDIFARNDPLALAPGDRRSAPGGGSRQR